MTVLHVTVPDQYFCTKHPDLNITAREKKNKAGTGVPAYGEIFTSVAISIPLILLSCEVLIDDYKGASCTLCR